MMVATIRMFKFSASNKIHVATVAGYYVDQTNINYYTESGEAPGEWFGPGAADLGLNGLVSKKELYRLLRGHSPDGKKQLVRPLQNKSQDSKRAEHVPGFDVTFSMPKSATTAWAIGSPAERSIIERCNEEAVKETLLLLQEQVPLIRRGKGGTRSEHGRLVAALFTHIASRNNNDPNLHIHAVIPNVVVNQNGETFKINSKLLLAWTRTLGPLYRNTLLTKLTQELKVEAYRPIVNGKEAGWFALKGIPPKLSEFWSSRTQEILEQVELSGAHVSDVTAQKAANLRTRMSKQSAPNRTELFEKWAVEAERFGFDSKSIQQVFGRKSAMDIEKRVGLAMDKAVESLTKTNATFERRELIQALSEQLQDVPVTGAQVVKAVDLCLSQSRELIPLERKGGTKIFTTKAIWEMEENLNKDIDRLSDTPGLKLTPARIESTLRAKPHLTEEQRSAVKHILGAEGSLACMTGVAGSGKSTALAAVVDAYRAEGRRAIGISLAGVAADNIELKTGAQSRTIESFLFHTEKSIPQSLLESTKHHAEMLVRAASNKSTWQRQDFKLNKGDVVILDEAGMLDTERGKRVLAQIVKSGASIVAVGDLEQLPPIGAGTPFRTMIERAGSVHLTENFRMKNDPLGMEAAANIRAGQIDKALEIYAKKGDLKVLPNRSEAVNALVRDWIIAGGISQPEKMVVVVHTREEAKQINRMCQNARLLDGQISSHSVKVGDQDLHVSDLVMFKANMGELGVRNGNIGKVTSISERDEITIQLEKQLTKEQIARGLKREVTLTTSKLTTDQLSLAYSETAHKLQGADREFVFYLAGGAMDNQQMAYTALSRSTENTKIYVDRDHAGPKLSLIATAMQKRIEKESAHEVEQRLQQELKIER